MCIVNDILNSIIFEQYLSRRNSLHAFVSWNPQGVWVQTPSVAHSRMYSEAFNPFEHCEFRFHQQWSSKGDHYSQSSHTLRTSMFIVCMRPPMRIGYWHVGALPLTQQWCLVLSLQDPLSQWVHRQAAPLIEYPHQCELHVSPYCSTTARQWHQIWLHSQYFDGAETFHRTNLRGIWMSRLGNFRALKPCKYQKRTVSVGVPLHTSIHI